MNSMFYNCSSLISLQDISKWNTHFVKNMSDMFHNCCSLKSLPDISKWNTQNVTNMSYIFYQCNSLSILPDISKWDTSQVSNMSYAFYKCNSLSFLPNISNWDTDEVTNINHIFSECYSLSYLPNISNLKFNNHISTSFIFNNCISILIISENNSKINIKNIDHNQILFHDNSENTYNKISLKHKNIIEGEFYIKIDENNTTIALFNSKINYGIDVLINDKKINMFKNGNKFLYNSEEKGTNKFKIILDVNFKDYKRFFEDCSRINMIDLSKFNSSSVTNMGKMFKNCYGLEKIIGLEKLVTNKVVNMSEMFSGCRKLELLDLSKFNSSSVTNMG